MWSLVLLVLVASAGQTADQPHLADLLERVARYVQQFERDFAVILSDEQYEQKNVIRRDNGAQSSTTRKIRSEMLFAWVPEEEMWLSVRNVLTVNGAAVPDSRNRLTAVLADAGPDQLPRLRRLRDEGARFNIGRIYHNFSDPTLVLQFLDARDQPRFVFSVMGTEKVNGADTWKLAFAERGTPTIVRGPTYDLPSTGLVWISGVDGAVVRTSLSLSDSSSNVHTDIVVDYRRDRQLNLWVPVRMVEQYAQQSLTNIAPPGSPARLATINERIEGVATYSNFRRFETSARIVP